MLSSPPNQVRCSDISTIKCSSLKRWHCWASQLKQAPKDSYPVWLSWLYEYLPEERLHFWKTKRPRAVLCTRIPQLQYLSPTTSNPSPAPQYGSGELSLPLVLTVQLGMTGWILRSKIEKDYWNQENSAFSIEVQICIKRWVVFCWNSGFLKYFLPIQLQQKAKEESRLGQRGPFPDQERKALLTWQPLQPKPPCQDTVRRLLWTWHSHENVYALNLHFCQTLIETAGFFFFKSYHCKSTIQLTFE